MPVGLMRAGPNIEFENNVSADTVRHNVQSSSTRHGLEWLATCAETDRECLIIGGGPSLAEDVPKIMEHQAAGAYILCTNGTARFLNSYGITPNALMILDARAADKNNEFLRCNVSDSVFLASQCDPSLFDESPLQPMLFHIDTPSIGEYVPGDRTIQAIGGGASVGLIALSLAYVRGFRALHLYGYDSSYSEGRHHAYTQVDQDKDDTVEAIVAGRRFIAAPWMVYQVEQFQILVPQLRALGCTLTVHGHGLLPWLAWQMTLPPQPLQEVDKYSQMWMHPEYRDFSPGEVIAKSFIDIAKPTPNDTVIDFGCGTGRGAKAIATLAKCKVQMVDFVQNQWASSTGLPFVSADITQPMSIRGDIGYCTDVLEHIPTDLVAQTIDNIMECVPKCYFGISLDEDNMGEFIVQRLHLSVFPPEWWADQFSIHKITFASSNEHYAHFYIERN